MTFNFNISVFGRREHYELISRVWLLRDVRSIYSTPFPAQVATSGAVYFFSPKINTVYSDETGSKCSIPWKSMKSSKPSWQTQQLEHSKEMINSNHSKFQSSFFINPKLKLCVPINMLENMFNFFQENDGQDNSKSKNSKEKDEFFQNDDPNDEFFQIQQDNSIFFTPLFHQNPPQALLANQSKISSDYLITTLRRHRLSLRHITPTTSSYTLPYVNPLKNQVEYTTSYEPSEHTAASILHTFRLVLYPLHLYPLCIIPIDLCDEASVNIAVWAYHTLLYQYNNNFTFPQAHTKIIIMLFNRVAYDMHIIRESQIHEWFHNFPLQVEFLFYPAIFRLPPTTEIDDDIRTISTLQDPNAPPTIRSMLNSHPTSNICTAPCSFTFDPHYLEQEDANIDLATQLDHSFTAQVQKHFLQDIFSPFRVDSPLNSNLQHPRPFIQSSIRYPFRSMIGKPIKLGITKNQKVVPFFVPNDMKHWCLFDKYDQDSICKYDRLTACGVLSSITSSTSLQTLYHNLTSHVTMFPDSILPSGAIHTRQITELSAIFPETHETRDSRSYDSRQSFHHCNHLRLENVPFPRLNSGDSEVLWTPERIFKEISTDVFDLLSTPFSIMNMNTPPQSNSEKHIQPPHHQFLSSLSPPKSSFHLIQQIFPPGESPGEIKTKESPNTLTIDHFSTLSVAPIHQFTTPYILFSSSPSSYDNSYNESNQVDCDQISAITTSPTSPTSPTEQINPPTTIYHSHVRPDRYYSTTYIDSETKQGLIREKISLLNSDLEDSPLLTNYPQQTLQIFSQLFTSSTNPSSELSSTPFPLEKISSSYLPDQAAKFSLSPPPSPPSLTNETPIISPLSPPHHFHLQFDPLPNTRIYQSRPLDQITYHSLLTYTVVNFADLIAQVQIIEFIRKSVFETWFSFFASLWQKPAQIDFQYSTRSMLNAFNNKIIFQSFQQQSCSEQCQSSPPINNNSSGNDLTPTKQLHTIISSTLDTPTFTEFARFLNQPGQINPSVSASAFYFHIKQNKKTQTPDRNILPHFLIVIDDRDQKPDKLSIINDGFATYPDATHPPFLSKEALIIQSYLSQMLPIATNARHDQHLLHYSFTPLIQLKSRMVECIQIAIAMRIDSYDFNSNTNY